MAIGQNSVGLKPDLVTDKPLFELGTVAWGIGKAYVYVQANGAVTGSGYAVKLDRAFKATLLTAANSALGTKVGVAGAGFADGQYGWVQVYGPAGVRSAANASANALLGPTATDGQVDAAASTGLYVDGVVFESATGGAAAVNATATLNWPILRTRPAPAT